MLIRKINAFLAAVITALLLTSCTSPAVLGTIYDRSATKATREFRQYAKFDDSQRRYISDTFSRYHRWHRETQLQKYIGLIQEVVASVQENRVTHATVISWAWKVEKLSFELTRCNPLNASADFFAQLTDPQATQIISSMEKKQKKKVAKYRKESVAERQKRRERTILKWARRAGLPFSGAQKELLTSTLARTRSIGQQRMDLWDRWVAQFSILLQQRHQDTFKSKTKIHIQRLWTLTKANYPGEWDENISLWAQFTRQFLEIQTPDQKDALIKIATKIASTIDSISGKKVDGPSAHCFADKTD